MPKFDKWSDKPVVCVASGPSLDVEAFPEAAIALNALKRAKEEERCYVATVNDAAYLCPYTDLMYACDRRWWEFHNRALNGEVPRPGTDEFVHVNPKAERWTKDPGAAEIFKLNRVVHTKRTGLVTDWPNIAHGGNSGYQVINLAYHFGAKTIYLLGYDCKNINKHRTHKNHFFGNHPQGWGQAHGVIEWAFNHKALGRGLRKRGVEVINCSIDTAITEEAYPRGKLEDYL